MMQLRQFSRVRSLSPPSDIQALSSAFEAVFRGKPAEGRLRAKRLRNAPGALGILASRLGDRLDFHAESYRLLEARARREGKVPPPFVQALAKTQSPRVQFAPAPEDSRMSFSPFGVPLVEVEVDGRSIFALFDTGCQFTSVSESMAKQLGAVPISDHAFSVEASHGESAQARLALLEELTVGSARLQKLPIFVFPDSSLIFPTESGSNQGIPFILGWDVIRKGCAILNGPRRSFRFQKTLHRRQSNPNFSWLGFPLVSIQSSHGHRLLFGLDTGSANSSLTPDFFSRFPALPRKRALWGIQGVGGRAHAETQFLSSLSLRMGEIQIHFQDLPEEDYGETYFVHMDGIFGSDIGKEAKITLDFPARDYRLEIPTP